jgi:hypothetical protein
MGRIYELPDKYSSSADGQTEVDKYTNYHSKNAAFTWRDGFPVDAKNTFSIKGNMDNTGPYKDAYPTPPPNINLSFMSPSLDLNKLFGKSMENVYHHIMPWQTKIIL